MRPSVSGPAGGNDHGNARRPAGDPVSDTVLASAWPRPARPRLPARLLYRAQPWLAPSPLSRRLAGWPGFTRGIPELLVMAGITRRGEAELAATGTSGAGSGAPGGTGRHAY